MEETNVLSIDGRLARELSGPAKIAALLKAHGYSYQRLAKEHGLWATQVKLCVYGDRAYPAVRDVLARVLDLPREEIDRLLDPGARRWEPPGPGDLTDAQEGGERRPPTRSIVTPPRTWGQMIVGSAANANSRRAE